MGDSPNVFGALASPQSESFDPLAQQYPQRQPTIAELAFFQRSPWVAGYAAPDGRVVLNPLTQDPSAQKSVLANERVRQSLYAQGPSFGFDVTDQQRQALGDMYAQHPDEMRHSLVARILAGDPSGAPYTNDQMTAARVFLEAMRQQLHQR